MDFIAIETQINARVETVWNAYNSAEDIMQWNHASDDWHCTSSINDLRVGGKFKNRMAAKDGSFGFDFEGTYTELSPFKKIAYTMSDGRKVEMDFESDKQQTKLLIRFEPEAENSIEMQRGGWQAILDNFKKYVESVYAV
ncbi:MULTISPECIES: SRPBCC family protein [Sphingobacterium]|uniref:SRPBCC family protein n=1 Tax=Sphingobacterium TaxID=28453 RepID=UPI0013DD4495|nr:MULTISPECIES: SRPBCC family protein [unclassified Sphingobacterium]